jgi:quercetin dioxygenase-like cupin family protein
MSSSSTSDNTTPDPPGKGAPKGTYRASPRPNFAGPTHITAESAVRHIWGDPTSGEVADWIYVSSQYIHALVFELEPHGWFRHSADHRTVFAADELLYVLEGVMAIANPETGEVCRVEAGDSVFFRRDTWHHAFAHGEGPLRVLELFAPPPATGSSGAYAQTRPYLADARYGQDERLGHLAPAVAAPGTLHRLDRGDIVWRRDLDVLIGLHASTEHLTAGVVEVDPGQTARAHAHGGDEIFYVTEGEVTIRAWQSEQVSVFELRPHEACYLPAGCRHEYRNFGARSARAVFGVAPTWLP